MLLHRASRSCDRFLRWHLSRSAAGRRCSQPGVRRLGSQKLAGGADPEETLDELAGVTVFGEERRRPCAFDGVCARCLVVRGESEHDNRGHLGADALRGLDPIHPGHRHVHHDDVWPQRVGKSQSFGAIGGFPNNDQLGMFVDQLS